MATATPAELQQLIANLSEAANKYDGTPNALDAENRANIREHARKVFLAMMSPDEMGLYHLLDVTSSPRLFSTSLTSPVHGTHCYQGMHGDGCLRPYT